MSSPRETYERPMIVKVAHLHSSKYGESTEKSIEKMESIAGISIAELTRQYGSPLFVYSEEIIRQTYSRALKAFKDHYPHVQFSWSYKTNYLKSICALYHQLGSSAEVVSEFEYQKARNLGVPGDQIIYNGPDKSPQSLALAIQERALIHLDGFEELVIVTQMAQKLKIKARVGLRINLNTGTYPLWSRFGFNYESGQALLAIQRILSTETSRQCLSLEGLHAHIGTFMLDPQSYELATSKLCDLFNLVAQRFGHYLQYLDLGGGFPSQSHLKGVYQPPEIAIKSIEEYAQSITSVIKNKIPAERSPRLYLESGRHLIDEAGFLITTTKGSKLMPDGRRSYVLDAGINILYTANWYEFKIHSDRDIAGVPEPAIFNGPLCMNIDVVCSNLSLPYIAKNTPLVLSPVGAYNLTQSMQFIKYRPAVVLIDTRGEAHLIKKSETLASVEQDELVPTYLALKSSEIAELVLR